MSTGLWIHIYQSSLYTIYWTSDDGQFDKRSYNTLDILRIFQLRFYSRIEFNIYINRFRFTSTLGSKSSPMIFTSVHENKNSVYRTKHLYETESQSVQKFTVSKFQLHRSSIKTKGLKKWSGSGGLSILTSEERKTDLKRIEVSHAQIICMHRCVCGCSDLVKNCLLSNRFKQFSFLAVKIHARALPY